MLHNTVNISFYLLFRCQLNYYLFAFVYFTSKELSVFIIKLSFIGLILVLFLKANKIMQSLNGLLINNK